ncbi:DUF6265 family protein [Candidatus Palauibacter soopunensis]|uniref:DUF6265 family protein n=1 Tax=Candidatus Palauibacter soopunensis TaxID=3056739 RepID=UPI00238424E2|nr:DUF6265 family protein [Candidatus Palauibacter soopunensis]MDE2879934.1 DUF6265 family protein [Candidatus Palauibacter soopunensis]
MACEDVARSAVSQTSPARACRGRATAAAVALAAVVHLFGAGAAMGQTAGPVGDPAPDAPTRAIDLDELAWIAGHWGGDAFGGQIEEAWFSPAGRSMSGSFRLVRDGLAVMYELLLLEQDDDGEIYYRFKHISRGWEPWEETRLEYRLTALEGRRATFRSTAEAPPSNAPWWFTYESPTSTELIVTIHGSTGGDPTVLSMTRR